ncbi:hypothetical protein I4U23_026854 [Adineta vaga]|nr:hypothetical protein I4U23_026854 [Adineta vaga]
MRIRAVLVISIAIWTIIPALILHTVAIFGKRWLVTIPRKSRGPNDQIHYYGLWTRCQFSNTSFVIPDISSQPNLENFVCRPNTYLRYNTSNVDISKKCYESRHQCSSIIGIHSECRCEYLHVTRAQQWCSIFAGIFLFIAICTLYLRVITTSGNAIAARIVIFVPVISLSLALILMVVTMILLGSYLRRYGYEEYDIKLSKEILGGVRIEPETVNYYHSSLHRYAMSAFKSIHNERYYTRIDRSACAEIVAIILTFLGHLIMRIRGLMLVSIVLLLGIIALTLHLLAVGSSRWKITKRDRDPAMGPVSYGLWKRCEYINMTIIKQGVALGVRSNVEICRPNRYMRFSPDKFDTCYYIHRQCPVMEASQLPDGCSCRYLPSTKALQWLTILAAIFLVLGLLSLYFRAITTPQDDTSNLISSFAPFLCFLLALLAMITTLILVGAYLRRDTYEDYTFPLKTVANFTTYPQAFDLHSLRNFAKHKKDSFSHERFVAAEKELRDDANTHYHTNIGWATGFEIIATVLLFLVTGATYLLGTMLRSDNV